MVCSFRRRELSKEAASSLQDQRFQHLQYRGLFGNVVVLTSDGIGKTHQVPINGINHITREHK